MLRVGYSYLSFRSGIGRVRRGLRYPGAFLVLAVAFAGCRHYHDALGYQARQAALAQDAEAFERLMARAADTMPAFPLDNPKRTVFSHFLALGAHDAFMPTIDRWLERGWVSDRMLCAVHRARYRGIVEKRPEEALESAEYCVARAREAAEDPERSWEIEACLDNAPFLTDTSTAALAPMLTQATDPLAPPAFRAAMLKAMTFRFISDVPTRLVNDPTLDREVAIRDTARDVLAARRRFEAILASVDSISDESLLARATAPSALEIERADQSIGTSFLAEYALSDVPAERDLAWAWVRAMKPKKEVSRLAPLGVWNRRREPRTDAGWFVCLAGTETKAPMILDVDEVRGHLPRRVTVLGDLLTQAQGDSSPGHWGPMIDRCRAQLSSDAQAEVRVVGPFPLASAADHWREGPDNDGRSVLDARHDPQ